MPDISTSLNIIPEKVFGTHPVQVCPSGTPRCTSRTTRASRTAGADRGELQAFFDDADDRVDRARAVGRKGWLAAFRDATSVQDRLRVRAAPPRGVMLDLRDFAVNPQRPSSASSGCARAVRQGEQGQPAQAPQRADGVAVVGPGAGQWPAVPGRVRPQSGGGALWLSERRRRMSAKVGDRFAQLPRALAGLPAELSVHCLRHSYVTHLIEDGVDPLFVQQQVGHA